MKTLDPLETEILASVAEKVRELAALTPGAYKIRKPWWDLRSRKGWVHVEATKPYRDESAGVSLMWTSARDTHQPLNGPAFCLSIETDGRLSMYSRSAISMHIVWGYGRGGVDELREAVEGLEWMHRELAHGLTPEPGSEAAPVDAQTPTAPKRRQGPR